ncbi:hypothetical protein BGZ83_006625 [Gryganskiella cystojenkinii]|nr:hypothetical protein BGZ83_006625 [Gryganskiella cystojenkinii]
MTTEQLEQETIPTTTGVISTPETAAPASDSSTAPRKMDMDKVSAAMGSYMLQGWTMLNDGCPDCNTPLMRNREATSQICVNCELNPPVDPEESADITAQPVQPAPLAPQRPSPPVLNTMSAPAPTAALPSVPTAPVPRPPSPQSHRASVLDPMMEARKALRPVAARGMSGAAPHPPSTPPPPPRSSTPLPMPPSTPPPAVAKSISGPLAPKGMPRPPGPPPSMPLSPPPSLPLSPPPSGALLPQVVPRDMKRSPQSSIIISGNILPPSTPPPPPPTAASAAAPNSMPISEISADVATTEEPAEKGEKEVEQEAVQEPTTVDVFEETAETKAETMEGIELEESAEPILDPEQEQKQQEQVVEEQAVQPAESVAETVKDQEPPLVDEIATLSDADDKGLESDDDFEDAEEEVFLKPTVEEIKEREKNREQSELASRLIGQKMLQGWAMLQDPCPNPSCHGVPLLRNREKKEYCVVCENYFQREQDLEHGKYTVVSTELPTPVMSAEISIATLPPALASFPPPPQTASPPVPPQIPPPAASPMASPSRGRNQRDIQGRVSSSIILPPAASMSPSFGVTSQQILGKHASEDFDKMASEDEEARRHIQIIRKVGEFSSKSLPPVPGAVSLANVSRPTSTYSNFSDSHESERPEKHNRHYHHHSQRSGHGHHASSALNSNAQPLQAQDASAPPPVPLAPEVQALVSATHKTIATLLVKLEAYRLALEATESPKECQVLTGQIKGLMECLSACRATL